MGGRASRAAAVTALASATAAAAPGAPRAVVHTFDTPPSLDDERWETLPAVELQLTAPEHAAGERPLHGGRAWFAADDEALYLRVELDDVDVCSSAAAGTVEGGLHQTGDVVEWFLGTPPEPIEAAHLGTANLAWRPGVYLELHVAPGGDTRAMWIARPILPEVIDPPPFSAEVAVDGTLNDASDTDRGWRMLMRLPREALVWLHPGADPARGPGPGPGPDPAALTTLVARYDHGHNVTYDTRGRAGPAMSMWPAQPSLAFHLRPFHASLVLADPPAAPEPTPSEQNSP